MIPIIFMILCTASFVSDLYFYINHKKNLGNLQSSNEIIIIVHFLSVRLIYFVVDTLPSILFPTFHP